MRGDSKPKVPVLVNGDLYHAWFFDANTIVLMKDDNSYEFTFYQV